MKVALKASASSALAALFTLLPAGAGHAAQVKIYISSGTGFFINRDGYVLTNSHVLHDCKRVTLAGAVPDFEAEIVARDTQFDLALLKINDSVPEIGEFRTPALPLHEGERVVVVGYPGDAYKKGATITREATILSPKGPRGEDRWLQLTDVVEQGNSGGPLLDDAGNVIGIIAAKAMIYTYRDDAPQQGTTSHSGIAISLTPVLDFLDRSHVTYRLSESNSMLSADRITDKTNRFVVNVRCEYKREVIR